MTMIDEDVLSEALHGAAEAIEVPFDAPERIVAATQVTPAVASDVPPDRARRPSTSRPGRARPVLVAAAVLLVVGVSLTALVVGDGPKGSSSGGSVAAPSLAHGAAHPAGGSFSAGAAGPSEPAPPANGAQRSSSTSGGSTAGSNSVPPLPSGVVGQSAKVEASGTIDLTIGNGSLQPVLGKLTFLTASEGGFVSSTQALTGGQGSKGTGTGTVVLRVPEPTFGTVVTQVQRLGRTTSVSTTATDVTSQYVDLQARITALQASRQQYLTIMAQASSIGDILAVQSQLDTLQSQIEQLQGQLNLLNSETTYGALTVSLSEAGHTPPPPAPHPSSGLGRAWSASVHGFVSGFEWLLRIAGPTLFILLCLAALAVLGRWAWRATRRRML